ncbi:hypothetical protein PILCRDRAFT_814403, partial [Piloderma croceum F 1598]
MSAQAFNYDNLLAEYKIIPYSITAVATLLVYDLICTVDQEVEYVWMVPCSIGTIMFVLNRLVYEVSQLLLASSCQDRHLQK